MKHHYKFVLALILLAGFSIMDNEKVVAEPLERIFQIDTVSVGNEDEPGALTICVSGTARTPGYRNIRLEPLGQSKEEPSVFEFALVAEPPDEMVIQVLTPVSTTYEWTNIAENITDIRILGDSNALTVKTDRNDPGCGGSRGASLWDDMTGET